MLGIGLADDALASQEIFYSMESVSYTMEAARRILLYGRWIL